MILTYIDSGVLIAATRGQTDFSHVAFLALTDPSRLYASSVFVQLELLSISKKFRCTEQNDLYKVFFETVTHWAEDFSCITQIACEQSERYGLTAMDALHIGAAITVGASEIITTQGSDKPIHKNREIRVVSIS